LFSDFSQHQKRNPYAASQRSQSLTAILLVSHSELYCMRIYTGRWKQI